MRLEIGREEERENLWMEREEEAVMVAVLNSLVEEEPFHSSSVIDPQTECSSSSPPPMASSSKMLKDFSNGQDFLFSFLGPLGLGFSSDQTDVLDLKSVERKIYQSHF